MSLHERARQEIFSLSLHDALPICKGASIPRRPSDCVLIWRSSRRSIAQTATLCCCRPAITRSITHAGLNIARRPRDRKSTRLNSSHTVSSYAVFCLKKKQKEENKN